MSGSTPLTDEWIQERLRHLGVEAPEAPVVWDDTTNYMGIERDHIVNLQGDLFLIRCNEHEGRFGLDDQPKFWVKRALALSTGQTYILKLTIQESFKIHVGAVEVLCVRNAEKEAKVLELVHGDPRFMQGRSAHDSRGNLVRVIDFIPATDLLTYIDSIRLRHEEYCCLKLPAILAKVADSIAALQRLHDAGLCHGDIRNDHILVERETGCYKWIDFDLEQRSADFDIWSVGNILHCVVAKGFMTFRDAIRICPQLSGDLSQDDASIFFPNRVMNLRKIYPYLPDKLNDVLLRFSFGARAGYDRISQITGDLAECAASAGW
jgi:serine/threonine protein kinase